MKSFKQYITELFDKPAKFDKQKSGGNFTYTAYIDGNELRFSAIRTMHNNLWNIIFAINGSVDMVDSDGNEVIILSTVLAMLKDFVESEFPKTMKIVAKSSESSRVSLYDRLIKNLARDYGYSLTDKYDEKGPDGTYKVYIINSTT